MLYSTYYIGHALYSTYIILKSAPPALVPPTLAAPRLPPLLTCTTHHDRIHSSPGADVGEARACAWLHAPLPLRAHSRASAVYAWPWRSLAQTLAGGLEGAWGEPWGKALCAVRGAPAGAALVQPRDCARELPPSSQRLAATEAANNDLPSPPPSIRSGFRLETRPDASPLASGVCSGEAAPGASKKRLNRAADVRPGLPPLDKPGKFHRGSCPTIRSGPPRQAVPLTVPVLLLRRHRSCMVHGPWFSLAPRPRPSQRPASCRRAQ